ncbi:hypothetical protein D3874_26340 [Oleomonas cavernae]|uniref:Uncharacterized protein n=2 Tax=Oleomonas cavernae TaxID=2320859 RepID=A0A418VU00_9PROT|nr:hypothetical protein D3874_26340 [Oleomonas cavernae]
MRDPTTTPPDNASYYKGDAQQLATCVASNADVQDECGDPTQTLRAMSADGGQTRVLRCAVEGSGGAGAGAAGAGLMGFIIGQAFDAAMEGTNADLAGYAAFVAAFRDVAPSVVEARLWITPVPLRGDARQKSILAAVDSCASHARLAAPPPSAPPGGKLIP